MIDFILKFVSGLIESAGKLGGLPVAGVWAFFTLILILYIVYDKRIKDKAYEKAWEVRLEEAKADGLIAAALEKLSNQLQELRLKIKCDGE